MKLEEIIKLVKETIIKFSGINTNIDNIKELSEELGFDTLDHVEFIMKLEEIFNITFIESDINKLHSFDDYVKYIQLRLNSKIQK